mmetsp:Transcript_22807/g.54031  ORF Transcript_22807/g.54031 Transcript_22807/m.54031 type:complete len:86 (+) Transcript_22807:140-397(+)|eukprot:CAMPEP_0197175048 /NCGR_PEP_ID=MMETSP1423-20130617/1378_1 /TAXON_ID=476441 /ORGANISM="Pseudo-nitzschia heimii, Strain UNC1101" /LENGTH=85 /DNA_ID=CAMNT_0042624103 /DNA_START=117 /DNA_END=374 /DNA_ORIENTATION=-
MTQPTISLFRRMMREARHFNDYNFRAYAIRRVRGGFEKNRMLEGDAAQAALQEGHNQLSALTRQSIISRLYPSAQSVMETPMAIE